MDFLIDYKTDIGNLKKTNQDGLLLKIANTSLGQISLFVICDGMGGLTQGEVASSNVIVELSNWFENDLPKLLSLDDFKKEVNRSLNRCILNLNRKILQYGLNNKIKLGTTLSALLIINNSYNIFHVGDSRIYKINNNENDKLKKLTKDQTFISREIERGTLTVEEAKTHPKRNTLLECIGVKERIEILNFQGDINKGDVFILCSDGFYHKITEEELISNFNYNILINKKTIKDNSIKLIELAKSRNEKDNISVIVVKCYDDENTY